MRKRKVMPVELGTLKAIKVRLENKDVDEAMAVLVTYGNHRVMEALAKLKGVRG